MMKRALAEALPTTSVIFASRVLLTWVILPALLAGCGDGSEDPNSPTPTASAAPTLTAAPTTPATPNPTETPTAPATATLTATTTASATPPPTATIAPTFAATPDSLASRLATDLQQVHASALASLEARDGNEPIDVLRVARIRPGETDAYRRFEENLAALIDTYGGTTVVSTHVEGIVIGDEPFDEVRLVRFSSASAYLAMLNDDAYAEVARQEKASVEEKTLLYGPAGLLLPIPSGGFQRKAFDNLTRDEAVELLVSNIGGANDEGNPETIVDMLVEDNDEEFFMLNLLEIREVAEYPNGEFPGSSGAEANDRYSDVVLPHLGLRNSGVAHVMNVEGVLVGDRATWQMAAFVRYSSVDAMLDMIVDPDFQAGSIHKFAALEDTQAMYTRGEISVPRIATEIDTTTINVDEFVFDALVAGPPKGDPVMLLHGFPETSWEWRHQLDILGEAGYRAVAPDQRGYSPGARPASIEDYGIVLLIGDVLRMADELGFDRFHLVGHDWGAAVAWGVGGIAPDRVITLNPISVPHPDAFAEVLSDPTSCQPEASSYFEVFVRPNSEDLFLANDAAFLRSIYDGLPPADVEVYVAALGTKEALSAALNWYRANAGAGGLGVPELGAITVPTMFIWSDNDTALCRDGAELTADFIDAPYRFEVVEGINHWVPENAAETVSALLLDHLDQ